MGEVAYQVERLLGFARTKGMIEPEDVIPCRNQLMDLLSLPEPYEGELPKEEAGTVREMLDRILDDCVERGQISGTLTERDLMDARIMGLLMPRAGETARMFLERYRKSPQLATDFFYRLSRDSNYIQVDRIEKNRYWRVATGYGELEITVNLSKPEKDPKEIAAAKNAPQAGYPKCLLCPENAGFAGHMGHPARQNLRLIPLTLAGDRWYFQYSPYVYYNEHCIVLNERHTPMRLTRDSFWRLVDFVEQFPHYFIGSNADLPIVGGSILTHDHFQGGRHLFPMAVAAELGRYRHPSYPGFAISRVKWPMSTIRISCEPGKREELITLAYEILEQWRGYSDPACDIHAHTEDTPHNTITPIVRYNREKRLEIDLVLRNNRTSEEHPLGIFHPHAPRHHIKKENIGLIEVMGLAVLPGRLDRELDEIARILTGEDGDSLAALGEQGHPLALHREWIENLVADYGRNMNPQEARAILERQVGEIFLGVLEDCGVYPQTEPGTRGFERFLRHLSIEPC